MPPALLPVDVRTLILSRAENQHLDPEMDFMASREKQARVENENEQNEREGTTMDSGSQKRACFRRKKSLLGVAHR